MVSTDVDTSIALMQRRLRPRDGLRAGTVTIDGSPAAFERCIDLLAWIPR